MFLLSDARSRIFASGLARASRQRVARLALVRCRTLSLMTAVVIIGLSLGVAVLVHRRIGALNGLPLTTRQWSGGLEARPWESLAPSTT